MGTWTKGMQSPNAHGRPKMRSQPSIKRMIERFVRRNISPRKLQVLYDKLEAKDQLTFMCDLLPYVQSKMPIQAAIGVGNLNDQQLDDLYNQVISNAPTLLPAIGEELTFEEIKPDNNGQDAKDKTA